MKSNISIEDSSADWLIVWNWNVCAHMSVGKQFKCDVCLGTYSHPVPLTEMLPFEELASKEPVPTWEVR